MPLPTLDNIDLSKVAEPVINTQEDFTPIQAPTVGPEGTGEAVLGLGERVDLAFSEHSPTNNLMDWAAQPFFPPEDGFNILDHKDLYEDLDEGNRDDIQLSQSLAEATWNRDKLLEEQDGLRRLMSDGSISGGALMLLPMVLDPTVLIGGVAEVRALQAMSKLSRVSKMVGSAAVFGATSTAMDVQRAAGRADTDAEDVMYNTLISMSLGAGIGALSGRGAQVVKEITDDMDVRLLASKIDDGTVTGIKRPNVSAIDMDESDAVLDLMGTRFSEPVQEGAEEGAEVVDSLDLMTTAGRNVEQGIAEDIANGAIKGSEVFADTKRGKLLSTLGISDHLSLYSSKSDSVKWFANNILESASGVGMVRTKSAAILKHFNERRLLNKALPNFRGAYQEFAQAEGVPWYDLKNYFGKTREKFNTELYMEMQFRAKADRMGVLGDYTSSSSKRINDLADSLQEMSDAALTLGKNADVAGMTDITRIAGYLPLRWRGKVLNGLDSVKLSAAERLLAKSYAGEGIPAKVADRISHAVIRRARANDLHLDTNPSTLFSKDSREFLNDILSKSDMQADEIDSIFKQIDKSVGDRGKASFAKKRTAVDLTLTDPETGVRLIDLVDTDVQSLMTRYGTEMSGRAALARKGIKSEGDWRTIKNVVLKDARANGDNADMIEKIIDATYDQMTGKPVGGGVNRNARRLMDLATTASLGMVGAAQTAEMSVALASHYQGALFSAVPELRAMRKGLKAGDKATSGVLGELNVHLGGLWDEQLLYRAEVRLNDKIQEDGSWMRTFDNILASATDKIGYASGMNQIKTMQQQFVVKMQTDKVFKYLKAGTEDTQILNRFKDMGWNEQTLAKLRKQIDNGNVEFQANGAVDRLNMEKWGADLVEDFGVGIHRHTNQLIQLPMIGEQAYWMHNTIASMLTQFRTFPLLAIEKQSARNIKMNDVETYMQFVYGTAMSTSVTLAKAAAMDLGSGESERIDKILDDPWMFAQASMKYASMFSVAPEAMSFIGNALGYEQLTSSGKSRGIQLGATDVPALGPPLRVAQGISGIAKSMLHADRSVTKRDLANVQAGMPLGNIYPAVIIGNLLRQGLDD